MPETEAKISKSNWGKIAAAGGGLITGLVACNYTESITPMPETLTTSDAYRALEPWQTFHSVDGTKGVTEGLFEFKTDETDTSGTRLLTLYPQGDKSIGYGFATKVPLALTQGEKTTHTQTAFVIVESQGKAAALMMLEESRTGNPNDPTTDSQIVYVLAGVDAQTHVVSDSRVKLIREVKGGMESLLFVKANGQKDNLVMNGATPEETSSMIQNISYSIRQSTSGDGEKTFQLTPTAAASNKEATPTQGPTATTKKEPPTVKPADTATSEPTVTPTEVGVTNVENYYGLGPATVTRVSQTEDKTDELVLAFADAEKYSDATLTNDGDTAVPGIGTVQDERLNSGIVSYVEDNAVDLHKDGTIDGHELRLKVVYRYEGVVHTANVLIRGLQWINDMDPVESLVGNLQPGTRVDLAMEVITPLSGKTSKDLIKGMKEWHGSDSNWSLMEFSSSGFGDIKMNRAELVAQIAAGTLDVNSLNISCQYIYIHHE